MEYDEYESGDDGYVEEVDIEESDDGDGEIAEGDEGDPRFA